MYGVEGFHLKDVLGIVAMALPGSLTTKPMGVDVETRGELTRGMSVIDMRAGRSTVPNVEMALGVEVGAVHSYMDRILRQTAI
jgi:inosine-uridine nucleoside N-ribohydrolase